MIGKYLIVFFSKGLSSRMFSNAFLNEIWAEASNEFSRGSSNEFPKLFSNMLSSKLSNVLCRGLIVVATIGIFNCEVISTTTFAAAPNIINISAKKFAYSPHEITIKKGTPTLLKLTTEDRSHGFSIPALNLRADILPGKVTELEVTPTKAGEYTFFCDVFCGSGHEGMEGTIKVTD